MSQLQDLLDSFNRKERYFVFTYATGNIGFRLGAAFREALGNATGVAIPEDAKAYIDYHIDWLHAAVRLATTSVSLPAANLASPDGATEVVSTGNQEDIDLLVSFVRDGVDHLVLVEAKADTGWTNSQLLSKGNRLGLIFGTGDKPAQAVDVRFCLLSPHRSVGISTSEWPGWMRTPNGYRWMELPVPKGRKKVIGCTQAGYPDRQRNWWTVVDVGEQVVE